MWASLQSFSQPVGLCWSGKGFGSTALHRTRAGRVLCLGAFYDSVSFKLLVRLEASGSIAGHWVSLLDFDRACDLLRKGGADGARHARLLRTMFQ